MAGQPGMARGRSSRTKRRSGRKQPRNAPIENRQRLSTGEHQYQYQYQYQYQSVNETRKPRSPWFAFLDYHLTTERASFRPSANRTRLSLAPTNTNTNTNRETEGKKRERPYRTSTTVVVKLWFDKKQKTKRLGRASVTL